MDWTVRIIPFLLIFLATPAHAYLDETSVHIPFIEKQMKKSGVRGASVVLIKNREVVFEQAFGHARPGGVPVTLDTEFEAASNGKMMTAYLIMQLIEEGQFNLDSPLKDERLQLEPGCEEPTISQALAHTAGLSNPLNAEVFTPACRPGKVFAYAGQGYMVLQDMVDNLASGTIEDVMEKRIFVPLEMNSASFVPANTKHFAVGHVDLAFGLLTGRSTTTMRNLAYGIAAAIVVAFGALGLWLYRSQRLLIAIPGIILTAPISGLLYMLILMQITVPIERYIGSPNLASSLQVTAPDLAKFALELMTPTLITAKGQSLMLKEQVQVKEDVSWAHGIGIDKTDGRTTYWHWGSNPGFQSLFVIDPKTGDGIVILTNTGGFLDFVSKRKGGYNFAKAVARELMGVEAAWDIRGKR
jgi:CubicO group peptidase (beta-lactamase class C family)